MGSMFIVVQILMLLCTILLTPNVRSFTTCKKSGLSWMRILSAAENEGDAEFRRLMADSVFRERNRRWVVIVDDEESIRQSVGDYLYDQGYKVTACADSTAVLQVVSLPPTSNNPLPVIPDVII